jgi:hypothetical protein
MAIAIIGDLPGGNAQLDQQIMQQIGVSPSSPPAGALARFAGPAEGGWRVISVWESQDAWDTFRRERMEPAFRQAGQQMPTFQVWQLETFFAVPQAR